MTVSDAIKVSTKDHIGTIVLNRPESRNAFTLEMLEECSDVLAHFRADREIRVIVLTGAGESFCSGGDVRKMGRSTTVAERKSDLWKRMRRCRKCWRPWTSRSSP
jgi:enoyl-CoA hydratase/carnithine racemase